MASKETNGERVKIKWWAWTLPVLIFAVMIGGVLSASIPNGSSKPAVQDTALVSLKFDKINILNYSVGDTIGFCSEKDLQCEWFGDSLEIRIGDSESTAYVIYTYDVLGIDEHSRMFAKNRKTNDTGVFTRVIDSSDSTEVLAIYEDGFLILASSKKDSTCSQLKDLQ